VDSLEFFPAKVAMPRTASEDMARIAAQELTHAMLHPAHMAPFSTIGGAQFQALRQLATIFDAALSHTSTGISIHVPSNGTNTFPSPGCLSPSYDAPVPQLHPQQFTMHYSQRTLLRGWSQATLNIRGWAHVFLHLRGWTPVAPHLRG
jgi:hypothetical protein